MGILDTLSQAASGASSVGYTTAILNLRQLFRINGVDEQVADYYETALNNMNPYK